MVKYTVSIFGLLTGKIALPTAVGQFSVSNMSFEAQPSVRKRDRPVLRECYFNLWNWACIDAKGLRSRT